MFFEGLMFEEAFKNLPQHLTTLGESAAIVGRDLVDRFSKTFAEINRRVADIQSQQAAQSGTKQTTTTTRN